MVIADFARILFGLTAVIGMIGIAAFAAKKAGLATASSGFVRKRRLRVVETLALDGRRRIAIIKCDDAEHLIVLGANNETVIAHDLDGANEEEDAPAPVENPFATMSDLLKKFRPAENQRAGDQLAGKDAA
jgi:flagellar protein FliO/FliZ